MYGCIRRGFSPWSYIFSPWAHEKADNVHSKGKMWYQGEKVSIVCMHACIYVCMHVCVYVCMYVCTYVRMYVCIYVYMDVWSEVFPLGCTFSPWTREKRENVHSRRKDVLPRGKVSILCMYACIYVCMHVYMYVCMHPCMYVCMCVCMYECMDVRMYVCMHVRMYVCMYVRMSVCIYVYMDVWSVYEARFFPLVAQIFPWTREKPENVHSRGKDVLPRGKS